MVRKDKRKTPKRKSTKKSKHTNSNRNSNKIDIKLSAGGGGGGGGAGGSGASSSFSFPLPYQQTVSQFTPLHTDMEKIPSLLQRVMTLEQGANFNSGRNDHSTGVYAGSLYRDSNKGENVLLFEDPTRKEFNESLTHNHPILGNGVETQLTNDSLFNNNDSEMQYWDDDNKKYTHYQKDNLTSFHTPNLNRIEKIYEKDNEDEETHFNNPALSSVKELRAHMHPLETNEQEKQVVHKNLLEQFDEAGKKKRGRPVGAKNKPKIYAEPIMTAHAEPVPMTSLRRSKSDESRFY